MFVGSKTDSTLLKSVSAMQKQLAGMPGVKDAMWQEIWIDAAIATFTMSFHDAKINPAFLKEKIKPLFQNLPLVRFC